MATIVHRRLVRLPAPAPRGPGASLSALTWIGWASLVVATGWFLASLQPVLDMGDARQWDWGRVAELAWWGLSDAAILALPAALEWGVPGARRRTPWLMRGVVLLALEVLAQGAISAAQAMAFTAMDPFFGALDEVFDNDSPVLLALGVLRLGAVVIGIAGVWALSDGLADAGGRIGRRLIVGAVVVGIVMATWYLPLFVGPADQMGAALLRPSYWLSLAGLALATVDYALWMVVAVRLVAGFRAGLRPRPGWAIGAAAGLALVVGRVLSLVLLFAALAAPAWLSILLWGLVDGAWILLAFAFVAGLGRGRVRREERPRRMRLFILLDPVA